MAVKSKTALNTDIDNQITTNGNNEITGADLNTILGDVVDSYENVVGSYTTAQIAALVGMTLRQRVFNTTDNDYEYYDGTRWVKEAHPKYKVYIALLTQTSTNAPVATVLENTLGGTVVWTRSIEGNYVATLASAFPSGKVVCFCGMGAEALTSLVVANRQDNNTVLLQAATFNGSTPAYENTDDTLLDTPIEIRVYY